MSDRQEEILQKIRDERVRQDNKFGPDRAIPWTIPPSSLVLTPLQSWFHYTGSDMSAEKAQFMVSVMADLGLLCWSDILAEEFVEAMEEIDDTDRIIEELVQVAAVAVAAIESLEGQRG